MSGASSWEPLADFDAALEPPNPPTILNGEGGALLYTGRRHIISGESESLKSWLALCALAEILGDGLCAVFVDTDDMGFSTVFERLRDDLGVEARRLRPDRLLYIAPETRFDAAAEQVVDRIVKVRGPVLAVIDALNPALRLQGLSNLATDDIEDFLRLVVGAFHRRGVATLIVDHLPKSSENRGRYSIGSERKLSGVDVAFGAEVVGAAMTRESPFGTITLKCHKDRPGWHRRVPGRALGTFSVDLLASPRWALDLATEGGAKGALAVMAERLGQVRANHPGATKAECARMLGVEPDHGTFKRAWAMARANYSTGSGQPGPPLGGPLAPVARKTVPRDRPGWSPRGLGLLACRDARTAKKRLAALGCPVLQMHGRLLVDRGELDRCIRAQARPLDGGTRMSPTGVTLAPNSRLWDVLPDIASGGRAA